MQTLFININFYDTVCNSIAFLDSFRIDKTDINALVQSIERSLLLIHKNIFSIKQWLMVFDEKKQSLTLEKSSNCSSAAPNTL